MARKISYREGIGDLLADGLPVAAKKIGKGAEDYLLISKGSPSDMHIPPIKTMVLACAVSPIGEDIQVQPFLEGVSARRYIQARDPASFEEAIKKYKDRAEKEVGIREAADPRVTEGKAALVRQDEERTDIADLAGVCTWMTSFIGLPLDANAIADFMSLGLGTPIKTETLVEAGLRMHHLERAFNCKCGLTRKDDSVSKGYYDRLRPNGKLMPEISFTETDLEKMKDDYYQIMGWDVETGIPTRRTLEKYGLADVADSLGL
jgi:aldehyde:ferredoxin oxidoreductase